MKYTLTTERYDTPTLQAELVVAGITATINGHGEKSFDVITDNESGADVIVQLHINKGDAQHDLDIDELDKNSRVAAELNTGSRGIAKAVALVILDEINMLRAQHSLPNRTIEQFKSAVKEKL